MGQTGLDPRWASPPGVTVAAVLEEQNKPLSDFASEIQLSEADARGLLTGEREITIELASSLSKVLGASPSFWVSREHQYREDLDRVAADDWSQLLPIEQMAAFGWISKPETWQERIAESFTFFDVPSVQEWSKRYEREVDAGQYRTSPVYGLDGPATSVWFRAGEKLAEARNPLATYDTEVFRSMLPQIRELTRLRNPEQFVPLLIETAAIAGVSVVVVPAPKGCPASGVARMLQGHPLIQLSARFLSDDHFWFTFFHEVGHVLHDKLDAPIIDTFDVDVEDAFESAANRFAIAFLLNGREDLLKTGEVAWTYRTAIRTATSLGISPGILVGLLQHEGSLPQSHLNRLKRRYSWDVGVLKMR